MKTAAFICASLLTATLASNVKAQSTKPPVPSIYVRGGLNISNITVDKNGNTNDNKSLASFNAGLMADLPIGNYFAIQPGLLFTGKGAQVVQGNTSGDNWVRATTRPYYIEIPVNAVGKIPLGDQTNLFLGAGPYLGIGVAGHNTIEGKVAGVGFGRTESIKFSNDDPFTGSEEGAGYGIMRRFDYGVNVTGGLQTSFAIFSVNYGIGLAKLQSGTTSSDDELNKFRVWSFNVGFRL